VGTQSASITATAQGGAAAASLTVVGVSLEPMQFVRTELDAGELLDVLLKLDRPPPVDITVVLEARTRGRSACRGRSPSARVSSSGRCG
jgi:hypothetical protein